VEEKENRQLKIVVRKTDDDELRKFHTRQRLTYYPEWYDGLPDAYEFNTQDERNQRFDLAKILLELDGVQEVGIHGYVVMVVISMAFDWEEVEGSVVRVLKQYLQALVNANNLMNDADKKDGDKGKNKN